MHQFALSDPGKTGVESKLVNPPGPDLKPDLKPDLEGSAFAAQCQLIQEPFGLYPSFKVLMNEMMS